MSETRALLEPLSKHAPLFAALADVASHQIHVLAFGFPDEQIASTPDVWGRLQELAAAAENGTQSVRVSE